MHYISVVHVAVDAAWCVPLGTKVHSVGCHGGWLQSVVWVDWCVCLVCLVGFYGSGLLVVVCWKDVCCVDVEVYCVDSKDELKNKKKKEKKRKRNKKTETSGSKRQRSQKKRECQGRLDEE